MKLLLGILRDAVLRRGRMAWALAGFGALAAASGEVNVNLPTPLGSGVSIKIYSPLNAVPHFGFHPLRVTIENQTAADGVWRLRFDAGQSSQFPGIASSVFEIGVPAAQTRDTWLYVPVAGPGVSVNAAAFPASAAGPAASLPNEPPTIPGVHPDPGLPGVSYRSARQFQTGPNGLIRTFTITQTGPAAALPPVSPNRLPPQATSSIATNPDGTVTRTTIVPITVTAASAQPINPTSVAMTNAQQLLRDHNLTPAGIRTSISMSSRAGGNSSTEATVTIRQQGSASLLPLIPPASLPKGFTSVSVTPEPDGVNATREFVYIENVSPRASPAPSVGTGVRMVSPAEAEAQARRVLAASKLLDAQPGVLTTASTTPIGSGAGISGALVAFEQRGPAALLPMPTAELPEGARVNVFPETGGNVLRVVTYMDPSAWAGLLAAVGASGSSPASMASASMTFVRLELQRAGFLRPQRGVTQGSPRNAGPAGAAASTLMIFSETGPGNLLPQPPLHTLPPGVTCNITPGALPGEVSRNFVVNIPALLAAAAPAGNAERDRRRQDLVRNIQRRAGGSLAPSNLFIEASGPGLAGTIRTHFPNALGATPMAPLATTPALEQVVRGKFSSSGSREAPHLAGFELAQMPADWRLWSSFNSVLLRTEDYETLDGARKAALRLWLTAGGVLFLSPETAGDPRVERVGMGRIETLPEPIGDVSGPDIFQRLQIAELSPGMPNRDLLAFAPRTPMAETVKFEPVDIAWVSVLLLVFAVFVGPVNFFWLAPAAKRHRLFLTTPLIALGATVVVVAVILLQDGWGGRGLRRMLVVFARGESQAVVFQEQAARTGFLSRRDFPLEDGVLCSLLPADGNVYTAGGARLLARENGRASGDWFGNRARQAQLLRHIAPTRARIEQVGTGAGGAPEIESTLTVELRDFRMRDEQGRYWQASSVPTGRRVILRPESEPPAGGAYAAGGGTPHFIALLNEAATLTEPGQWVATGGATDLAPIPTHRSIRWSDDPVVYSGIAERSSALRRTPADAAKGGGK